MTFPSDAAVYFGGITAAQFEQLSAKDVRDWAVNVVGVNKEHAEILLQQELDGDQLLKVTKQELNGTKIPLGAAGKIVDAVLLIKTRQQSSGK
jgi:hypothetical protein